MFGTSPETVRKVFQQRSRWCKGQMQVGGGGGGGTLSNPNLYTWQCACRSRPQVLAAVHWHRWRLLPGTILFHDGHVC